ncbi:MAG: winged helix-turn-helix domain-containing protein [Vicinamibacterales bacterium]
MSSPTPPAHFGPFVLDLDARALHRNGQPVALPPKAMELLVVLVQSAGTLVTKDDLMRRVWPDTFVEEGNLPVTVFTLRKALGDDGEQFIRTVPRRGYCFVGEIRDTRPAPPAESARPRRLAVGALVAGLTIALAGLGYAWSRSAPPPAGSIRSVAVLPFTLVDIDAANEYQGPGVAADVIARLTALPTVVVRPMSSSLKYGGEGAAVEAGRALRADAVVTGTLRQMGGALRVSAQLTRVSDGARLWSLPASQELVPLLKASGLVADGIAATLVADLTTTAHATFVTPETASEEAYRSYLQGLALGSQMTAREVGTAVERFERAVAADPQFAAAHTALATYSLLPASTSPTPARIARARSAAEQALALQPDAAPAHAARAMALAIGEWKWDAAGDEFRQAIAARPNDPEHRLWHSLYLSALSRHDEAIKEVGLALELDPTGPRVNFYRGFLLLMARRYDDAISQFRQTPLELGVVTQQVAFGVAVANAKKARFDQARAALERIITRAPSPQARAHSAFVLAESGDRTQGEASLKAVLGDLDQAGGRTPRVMIAATQACLGQMASAFESLEQAPVQGDSRIAFVNVDPALDCARTDPRFPELLERFGLAR